MPPGAETRRHHGGHVHAQGQRRMGRAGERPGAGRVRHHGELAGEHRGGGGLHIKEKSAARSTIFLVCRVRGERHADSDAAYWEEVEPRVAAKVRERIDDFQKAGIGGIDLYLASFGPALQVFSESWPLTRGLPITRVGGKAKR